VKVTKIRLLPHLIRIGSVKASLAFIVLSIVAAGLYSCGGSSGGNPPLSPDSSPLETVTTFFADWNMGEIRAASKLFDQEPCVTDAFPRFHWQGKKAFREWFSDLDIYNQSQGFTDYDFEVGTPLTNDVEGALANVIVPVVLNLKHDGRPESFTGLVNVVLQRNRASWKITAFTWTDNQPG
jgi:hypothetical protein